MKSCAVKNSSSHVVATDSRQGNRFDSILFRIVLRDETLKALLKLVYIFQSCHENNSDAFLLATVYIVHYRCGHQNSCSIATWPSLRPAACVAELLERPDDVFTSSRWRRIINNETGTLTTRLAFCHVVVDGLTTLFTRRTARGRCCCCCCVDDEIERTRT